MQVMASYKVWVKLFEHLYDSCQGDRISSLAHNGVAIGKSKKLKCDRELFCGFSRAFWSCQMKWLHFINRVAKKFGHSSPLMLVHLILVLDNIQEVKMM